MLVAESVTGRRAPCPSFKGYHGFPASICASVNEQIVHGIPNSDQVLREGDLVSLDAGRCWTAGTGRGDDGRRQ